MVKNILDNRTKLSIGYELNDKKHQTTYVIEGFLGSGGSSLSYLVRKKNFEKNNGIAYVIKEVYPKSLENSIERYDDGSLQLNSIACMGNEHEIFEEKKQEAIQDLSSKIIRLKNGNNSPYLVANHVCFEANNTVYSVWDAENMCTFSELLETDNLEISEKLFCFCDVLIAVGAMHGDYIKGNFSDKELEGSVALHPALHLDISPDNILFFYGANTHHATLIDYNCSALLEKNANYISDDEKINGYRPDWSDINVIYRAKGVNNVRIDKTADIYSLGILLYKICFDSLPSSEDIYYNTDGYLDRMIESYPKAKKNFILKKSFKKLDEILCKAIHWDNSQRYQTVDEFYYEVYDVVKTLLMNIRTEKTKESDSKFIKGLKKLYQQERKHIARKMWITGLATAASIILVVNVSFGIYTTRKWNTYVDKIAIEPSLQEHLILSEEYDKSAQIIYNWNQTEQKQDLYNQLRSDYNQISFNGGYTYKIQFDEEVITSTIMKYPNFVVITKDCQLVQCNMNTNDINYTLDLSGISNNDVNNIFISHWSSYVGIVSDNVVNFYVTNDKLDLNSPLVSIPFKGKKVSIAYDESDTQAFINTDQEKIYVNLASKFYRYYYIQEDVCDNRYAFAYTNNGHYIASIDQSGKANIYAILQDGSLQPECVVNGNYIAADFSIDGKILSLKKNDGVVYYDIANKTNTVDLISSYRIDFFNNTAYRYGNKWLVPKGNSVEINKKTNRYYTKVTPITEDIPYNTTIYSNAFLTDDDTIYFVNSVTKTIDIYNIGLYQNQRIGSISLKEDYGIELEGNIKILVADNKFILYDNQSIHFFKLENLFTPKLIKSVNIKGAFDISLKDQICLMATEENLTIYNFDGEIIKSKNLEIKEGFYVEQIKYAKSEIMISANNAFNVTNLLVEGKDWDYSVIAEECRRRSGNLLIDSIDIIVENTSSEYMNEQVSLSGTDVINAMTGIDTWQRLLKYDTLEIKSDYIVNDSYIGVLTPQLNQCYSVDHLLKVIYDKTGKKRDSYHVVNENHRFVGKYLVDCDTSTIYDIDEKKTIKLNTRLIHMNTLSDGSLLALCNDNDYNYILNEYKNNNLCTTSKLYLGETFADVMKEPKDKENIKEILKKGTNAPENHSLSYIYEPWIVPLSSNNAFLVCLITTSASTNKSELITYLYRSLSYEELKEELSAIYNEN